MRVPPYFTHDNRFLILQLGKNLYVVDVISWKLQFQVKAFPIGISKDETLLLAGNINPVGATISSIYEIETGEELPLKEISPDTFEVAQRLYFLNAQNIVKQTKSGDRINSTNVIFQDSFSEAYTQQFELGITCIKPNSPIYKTLASPTVAIHGSCKSDWGGFDFVWIGNLDTSEIIYIHSLMENAPMTVNYTPLSRLLTLTAGDGVHVVDVTRKTQQDEARRVFAAKPFNVHSVWMGEAERVDSLAHPSDSNRVIVAWRKNWYEVYLSGDEAGVRIKDKAKTLDTEIITMAYHPDGQKLVVLTKQDIRLYEIASGELLEETPIS
jgi:hypothetical protein